LDEKIHPDNTVYVETVIHRSNLNLKIIDLKLAHCEAVDSFSEHKLCATNTTNPMHRIIRLIRQADS